jgi:PAS domain S-box-containing protein
MNASFSVQGYELAIALGCVGILLASFAIFLIVLYHKRGASSLARETRLEQALQRNRNELHELIDLLPALIWRATPDGEPDHVNRRITHYTGRTLEDFLHLKWQDLVHPDDIEATARAWNRARATEETFTATHRIRGADGSYRWFQLRGEPLRDQTGKIVHWYGVNVDIDDSRKMEDALRSTQARLARASQIATLAELSASIAHEINQPLAAVVANGHASQRWLAAAPPNVERARLTAERIIRDGNAAAEVVSRIRALFRQQALMRTSIDLNDVIAEVCQLMIDEIFGRNVSIDVDLERDLPQTLADRVQIQQVLINLARNGVEAMEAIDDRPKVLLIRSRRQGEASVLIEVRDQGCGFEDAERIFEPFFTTKLNGMGMGLAICRSIIETHRGRLWVVRNSALAEGKLGTTFSFTLPIEATPPR